MEEKITELILIIISLISLCMFPASALEFSEEKIIFVADETAGTKFAIDSGNIFIMELCSDKNDGLYDFIIGWSKLYFYNISTDKLTELTFDDMPDTRGPSPIAISGNTVYWTVNSDLRSYDIISNAYNEIPVQPSRPIDLAVQDKTIALTATDFPNDIDGADIYISTDAGTNFKRYKFPDHAYGVKISGNIVSYFDDIYGQMRNTIHYLNIDTGESHQIGDETKGVYLYPDISGSNIVYRFDPDFSSFLKGPYDVNQELYMTDISTNKTSLIASPNARICSFAIDKDYIVWGDNRNKSNYKFYLYDLKENKEYYVADINAEYGSAPLVSKNTIVWADGVDNKGVIKIVTIHDENYVDDDISSNSGTDDTDNTGNPDSTQPQQTSTQTASGEIVCIIISVGIALIAKAGYHGRKK